MRNFLLFVLISVVAVQGAVDAQSPLKTSAVPAGVSATLYADGPHVDVLEVAAEGPWLYVALRDLDGAQFIDVWRVAPPAAPARVDTLVYPDLQTAPFAFIPLAIVPRNGVVLIQAEEVLRSYRQGADGKLNFIAEMNPVTGLGGGLMGRLSAGGAFASHEQQVVPNNQIGTVPESAIHQQVVLSLRDPAHPFLIRAPGDAAYKTTLDTDEAVNTVWQGKPASISIDDESGEIVLTTFERTVTSHLDSFWSSKLDGLFAGGALDQSLEVLIRSGLKELDLPAIRLDLIAEYEAALDISGVSLEGLIRGEHPGNEGLEGVIAAHGLSLDESLEISLRKLAVEGLDESLRAELGRLVFQPALEAWLDATFGIAWEGLSSAQLAAEIAVAFDADLDSEGAVRYLTLSVIAPLLDDPEFMTWTLGDLIDALVESDAGAVIDTALTVTGVGLIAEVLAIIDDLPGFSLPNCALFPGNARGLIDLALFSGGADLDVEGLAWFEMLKLYQYLTGGTDFNTYTAEVDAALRELHFDLAEDFTDKYLGFFAGIEGFAVSDDALAGIAEYASVDQLLGDVLARAAMARLETAGHATDVSLREFLQAIDVPFNLLGEVTGDVDELIAGLSIPGLHAETAGSLFVLAETRPFHIEGYLEAYLIAHLKALFGVAVPDMTLRAALYLYLTEQFDLSTPLGVHLGGLLDGFVVEVQAQAVFGAYLTNVLNAFDGDCIAQWMLALDVATGIATPFVLEAYPIAAKAALSAAYHAGIEAAISTMFSLIAEVVVSDLSGHWASWSEQVTQTTYRFAAEAASPGFDLTLHGAYVWEAQVFVLVSARSQADPFGLRPVSLIAFDPDAPEASRSVTLLGDWVRVEFVAQAGKDLLIGGAHPFGGGTAHALIVDLDRVEGRHFLGDDALPLTVTQGMAALDGGAVLALQGESRVTLVPNASAQSAWQQAHAGDTDGDGAIDLSELLRVIQFYNSQGYHCDAVSEDGFAPGSDSGAQDCAPHASDYNAQDWFINLSELLRFIQFYNTGGYVPCLDGEDNYCPQAG